MIALHPLSAIADIEREALLDRAFGTDRQARTAYRIRGVATPIPELSFAAIEEGVLVGSVQCWPVAFTSDAGEIAPLVMIGPVAVDPALQRGGIGRLLMDRALAAAAKTGLDSAMMLIGDPEYYGRFFDFSAMATSHWRLPGPVERHRLLARGPAVPSVPGVVGGRIGALA